MLKKFTNFPFLFLLEVKEHSSFQCCFLCTSLHPSSTYYYLITQVHLLQNGNASSSFLMEDLDS